MTAPVDPRYASPEAATETLLGGHDHSTHDHGKHPATEQTQQSASTALAAAALDPAVYGQWAKLGYQLPLRAIHATLLHTGNFLLIAGSGNVANDNVIKNFKAYVWNPTTGALLSVPVPYDAFCAGHLVDPNGDVIIFGGTQRYKNSSTSWTGSNKVYKFVVATSTWVEMPSMRQGRWYPTNVIDGQGRYYSYSGQDATGATPIRPEVFDPSTNTWNYITSRQMPLYPALHLLKDGRLAYTGAYYGWTYVQTKTAAFNPFTTSSVTVYDPTNLIDRPHRNMAMSALVGSADNQLAWVAGGGFPAVRTTYFINFNQSAPRAEAGPLLPAAKGYVSVSHLPDLTALETNGGTAYNSPVYETSILNPSTRKLTAMAPPTVPRTYHSSSVTMPDGRVVTFGGDPTGDANFELRIEIFSPPYLFKGPRPVISSSPTEAGYGSTHAIEASATDASVSTAVLMRPGSATHSLDANQRVLILASSAVDGGLNVTLPTNRNLAPPGWYMLFVNDSLGRPSVGKWIHLT